VSLDGFVVIAGGCLQRFGVENADKRNMALKNLQKRLGLAQK
jgi:hypothetical protein